MVTISRDISIGCGIYPRNQSVDYQGYLGVCPVVGGERHEDNHRQKPYGSFPNETIREFLALPVSD